MDPTKESVWTPGPPPRVTAPGQSWGSDGVGRAKVLLQPRWGPQHHVWRGRWATFHSKASTEALNS